MDRYPWENPDLGADLAHVGAFVRQLGADHDRPRTSEARWKMLRRITAEIGVPLHEASGDQIKRWWYASGTRKADGGKRKPATRAAARSHLVAFLRWAVEEGLRPDNPAAKLPSVRITRRHPRPADRAEVARVLATAAAPARRAILLAVFVGLRVSEISPLTRADLQRNAEGRLEAWIRGKGGHLRRVDIPAALAEELLAVEPGEPLVPSRSGRHLSPDGISRLISRTFFAARSTITAHQLRHLCATELYNATKDLLAVAEQLGHRNVATTAGYAAPGRSVVDALDGLYGGTR